MFAAASVSVLPVVAPAQLTTASGAIDVIASAIRDGPSADRSSRWCEAEAGTVSLRHRSGDDLGAVPVDRVVGDLAREIAARESSLTVGRS